MKKLKLIAGGIIVASSMFVIVSFHSVQPEMKLPNKAEQTTDKLVTLVNERNVLQSAVDTNEKSDMNSDVKDNTMTTADVVEEKIVIEEKTFERELQAKKVSTSKNAKKRKKVKAAKKSKKKKSKKDYSLVGDFKITGYCNCASCCGKTNGITASGTRAKAGRTIAADTSRFPFGTKLKIGDNVYTVEDRGGAIRGNRIDVFFSSHSEALRWGVKYCKVYVKK